jgi:hypothetical protein
MGVEAYSEQRNLDYRVCTLKQLGSQSGVEWIQMGIIGYFIAFGYESGKIG